MLVRMENDIYQAPRRVLKELYIGIIMWISVIMILGVFVMRPLLLFEAGLIVGGAGACLQAYGIYDTLDRALELSKKNAKSFAMVRSILRLILCLVLMGGAALIHWSAFVGTAVGLISLKVSALLNPVVKKIIYKNIKNSQIHDKKDMEKESDDNISVL